MLGAINFANHNAEQSRTTNVEFYGERVKNFLRDKQIGEIDFVLLDPPRSGVKRSTMEGIADLGSPKITYVSCNPSTLARDLQVLIEKGYKVRVAHAKKLRRITQSAIKNDDKEGERAPWLH